MISVKQVSKSYRNQLVLSNISFRLGNGQKAALVGYNGAGKSTLLRIIAGIEEKDSGEIELIDGACIGYLSQQIDIHGDETIEFYLRRIAGISDIEKRMAELENNLTEQDKLEEYLTLQDKFGRLDGYQFESRVRLILNGFGFEDISKDRPLHFLSGGEKSKIALAGILLKGVDVLLLDEPTNNLDFSALIWLEGFLRDTTATMLMVSHDRRFIDGVVSKVFEIDWQKREIVAHRGGYTDYLAYKKQEIERQIEAHDKQQEEIERLEEAARKKRDWARRGAQQESSDRDKFSLGARRDRSAGLGGGASAIDRRIEQMEKIEKPKQRLPLVIHLDPRESKARHAVTLSSVVFGYKDGFQSDLVNLTIAYGERIGILGANGSGKSTLLKVITGEIKPLSGSVVIGPSLVFGNLMQAHENLPLDDTLYDFIGEKLSWDKQGTYHLLRNFHFEAEEVNKKISCLSPGGRARLLLAMFSAIGANILILDEPTNHLDLEAVEALEDVLHDYAGTVILVSHDRYFIENAGLTDMFLIQNGSLQRISDFVSYVDFASAKVKKLPKKF